MAPRSPIKKAPVLPAVPIEPQNPEESVDSLEPDQGENDEETPSDTEDYAIELARVRQALKRANELIAALRAANSFTPVPEVPREPKVNKPTPFGGKLSEYRTFLSQCLLTFEMCPSSFKRPEQKVLFVISYLTGTPRDWAVEILNDENHPLRSDFAAFKKALDSLYADRNLKQKARDRLSNIAQTKSVAAYSAEFQQIIAPLNLDPESKCSMFYKGLHDDIKKSLLYFKEAETFEELLEQCVSIDQRHRAVLKREKLASKPPPSFTPSKPQSKPPSIGSSHNSRGTSSQPSAMPKPFSKGPRGPITEQEKQRRSDKNLCYRCASPDHIARDCPLAKVTASHVSTPMPQYQSVQTSPENWLSQSAPGPAV